MGDYIEPADLAEADANAADYPTVAAQQCGLPEGLDATDMDMIRRGDMLGPVLGARVATLIQSQAARIAELEAGTEHKNAALDAAFAYLEGSNPLHASGGYRNADLRDKVRIARSVLNGERKG